MSDRQVHSSTAPAARQENVSGPIPPDSGTLSMAFTRVDVLVLIGFAVFALANFVGRWKGIVPFVFLGSDAGIVASFVAGYDSPDLFRHDVLLADFANFKYYLAMHPVLIHYLKRLIGDYGTAYISLLFFTAFLQTWGFYILGRILFRDRLWAVLLSILALCPIALPVREFWGIYDDPLPRSLFHAFLPYVLAGALKFKHSPGMWPWLMAGMGVAFYAHPVSAPPWAFALWLGMWLCLPTDWGLWKRLGYMFLVGMAFIAVVLPWVVNFALVHANSVSETVSYGAVIHIIANRVGQELLSVRLALSMWGDQLSSWPLGWYTAWALGCGLWLTWAKPEKRQDLGMFALWAVGILVVSVGLTYLEETICRVYGLRRFQMDSIRGCKYLIPLGLILSLWPLAEFSQRGAAKGPTRWLCRTLGVILVSAWTYVHPPVYFLDCARSWVAGCPIPPLTGEEAAVKEAIAAAASHTDAGSTIFPSVLPLEIRYSALRPVVYAYKDGGIFADTNLQALVEWDKVRKQLEDAEKQNLPPEKKLSRLMSLCKRTKALYLLTDIPVTGSLAAAAGSSVVWSNSRYSLVKCAKEIPDIHESRVSK